MMLKLLGRARSWRSLQTSVRDLDSTLRRMESTRQHWNNSLQCVRDGHEGGVNKSEMPGITQNIFQTQWNKIRDHRRKKLEKMSKILGMLTTYF